MLDPTRKPDLLFVWLLAAWPAALAFMIGAHRTIVVDGIEFAGYWVRLNWLGHAVWVPIALHLFRWAAGRLASVHEPWPPRRLPSVVSLVTGVSGQEPAYRALRSALLSRSNLRWTLVGLALFHLLDMWEVVAVLLSSPVAPASIREPDWTVMAAVVPSVPVWANLLLVIFAYAVQATLLLIMVQFVVLVLRHNLFFLSRTYQRRRVQDGAADSYLVIDVEDPNRCFGFRSANEAFNTQVLCLTLAGIGLLFSRFGNVSDAQTQALYDALADLRLLQAESIRALFPDIGQWVLATAWLASMAIISLPALVKLLPRMPFTGGESAQRSIVDYLREFFPPSMWPWKTEPTVEEVNALAARFAENAFWPTGNNRAVQLFFFSFWVFLVVLFPLAPQPGRTLAFITFHLLLMLIAAALTATAFQLLRWSLGYIDVRLVRPPRSVLVAPPDTASSLGSRRVGPRRTPAREIGPGARLGDFEVIGHLASGGMGAVYRARDTRLGRELALKVLPTDFGDDAERLHRFEREAQVLAQLNHPNIATLYTFGQEGETRFLAMELIEGETLDERLQEGALGRDEAMHLGRQLAGALAEAHRRGIIHRDLKPGNVMLRNGDARLLDFGLAKGIEVDTEAGTALATGGGLTASGTILGTLHYMSPEQLRGEPVDRRADIFSFGALLYEMLAGAKAFPGESQATVIGAILHAAPAPLVLSDFGHADRLTRLVDRCLQKDRTARFDSFGEVQSALDEMAAAPPPQPHHGHSGMTGVLPFHVHGDSPELNALADALGDEITALLGRTVPMVAWARMRARAADDDPASIATELGAVRVVQGSIRGAEERVRVAVRLLDGASGTQRWDGRFDVRMGDQFDMLDELSAAIAEALSERLGAS